KTAWARMPLVLFVLFGVASLVRAEEEEQQPEKKAPELPKVEVVAPQPPAVPEMSRDEMNLRMGIIPWNSDRITSDDQRVGTYNQPVWTTQRPFSTTRTYVLPNGTQDLEQWVRPTWNKTGKLQTRFLEEWAVGLPCRMQLDVYERWDVDPNEENNDK